CFSLGLSPLRGSPESKGGAPARRARTGRGVAWITPFLGRILFFLGIPPVFSERRIAKKRESVRCLTLWCNARYAKSAGGCGAVADKEKEPWDPRWSGEVAHSPASQGSSLLQ